MVTNWWLRYYEGKKKMSLRDDCPRKRREKLEELLIWHVHVQLCKGLTITFDPICLPISFKNEFGGEYVGYRSL